MIQKITILYPFRGKTFGGGHVSIISMIKLLDKKSLSQSYLYMKKGF